MKPLITFLLFLFCYLTGGAVHFYNAPANKASSVVTLTRDKLNVKVSSPRMVAHLEKISNLNQDTPDVLLREEEDDESIIKTHIRKYYAFFSDVFFPVEFTSPKETISFGRDLYHSESCKYIVQRVLRI